MGRGTLSGAVTATATTITIASAGSDEAPQAPSGWLYVGPEAMLYSEIAGSIYTVQRGLPIGIVGRDHFTRDVPAGGWGRADVGDDWTGANAGQLVDGAVGIMQHTVADSDDTVYLSAARHHNVEVLARLRWDQLAAGAELRWAVRVRRQGDGATQTWYELRAVWNPGGVIDLAVRKSEAGTASTVVAATASTVVADSAYAWLRFLVTGQSAVRVAARVWADGSEEPTAWLLDGSDATPSALIGGWGYLGLESRVAAAYTGVLPVEGEIDYLEVREVAEPVAHADGAPVVFLDRSAGLEALLSPLLAHGEMVYMGPDGMPHRIPAASAEGQTLTWRDGRPQWVT